MQLPLRLDNLQFESELYLRFLGCPLRVKKNRAASARSRHADSRSLRNHNHPGVAIGNSVANKINKQFWLALACTEVHVFVGESPLASTGQRGRGESVLFRICVLKRFIQNIRN